MLDSLLCFMHCLVDLIESVYREQKLVQFIHFHRRIEDRIQRKVVHRAMTAYDIHALAMRADQAASIYLDFVVMAEETELDRIPEQAPQLLQHALVINGGAHPPV